VRNSQCGFGHSESKANAHCGCETTGFQRDFYPAFISGRIYALFICSNSEVV